MKKIALAVAVLLVAGLLARAQEPTSQPTVLSASDKEGIAANMGKEVIVEGTISKAEWSRTGAVMNIDFANAEESRMLAVVFVRNRQKLDEEFAGDLGKALTGAKVRIKGKLQEYGGRSQAFMGRPQIIINSGSQVTIVEPAPATQPAQ